MAKVLSIIAPEKFQQVEYLQSKKALEESGHAVVTCSTHQMAFDKQDHRYKVDVILDEVFEDEYDAVLFIGGPGIYEFHDDSDFQSMARAFHDEKKVTAAICAAPTILARAGLLEGVKMTCFEGEAEKVKASGANYTGGKIEKDGLILTADGPDSAYEFGLAMAGML